MKPNALRQSAVTARISPIEEIIDDARNGKMFVLADDEGRENEGDLVIPAQFATPEAVNFMARHGRGLICLAMEQAMVDKLGLPPMSSHNSSLHQTAFTVSIEAREGVTTGISAADRSRTIQAAIAATACRHDIVTPGHVFPLSARDGGVLVRAGHTEAAVDIARLAGLAPAGVICEIMNDDGSMARLPDLARFSETHGLKLGTVADLIEYRRRTENLVERKISAAINSIHGGEFALHVYVNRIAYAEHAALVKGDVSGPAPCLVRMHALNALEDVLGCRALGHGGELEASMRMIAEAGRGAIVLLREARPDSLSAQAASRTRPLSSELPLGNDLRDYGVGAQVLLDLGIRNMILLSNSVRNIVGLEGYGLRVVEQRPIRG